MSAWSEHLDTLMRERGAALFGYAYVLTGDRADAEDLLQEALVRTFRTRRGASSLDHAHAYVKRAMSTAFIDSHRRTKARPQRADGDRGDLTADPAVASAPDHADGVADRFDLHTAILQLPPRERACVVLRYLDDLPVAGVAAELGLAVGTVKRYLSDGVKTLRAVCTDIDFAEPDTVPVSPQGGQS